MKSKNTIKQKFKLLKNTNEISKKKKTKLINSVELFVIEYLKKM